MKQFVSYPAESRKIFVTDPYPGGLQGRGAKNVNSRLDLDRLRTRVQEKPRTKAGQIRQAWPEIKELLAAGHTLKDIWGWLHEIGLEIGYARLSHYIGQLRRRDEAAQAQIQGLLRRLTSASSEPNPETAACEQALQNQPMSQMRPMRNAASDPLRNLREQRARKKTFEYNPFPTKGLTQ